MREEPICQPCRKELRQRTCEQCGVQFEARGRDRASAPNRFCSAACRVEALRLHDDPRASSKASTRARKVNHRKTWDGVTDKQIFERDGWICQIPGCGLPILPDLKHPDPGSASVDHIIPCSRADDNLEWDAAPNKRAAHKICNERRGNRMHADDLQVLAPELVPLIVPPRLRQAKPREYCVACQAVRVSRAGATCRACQDATLAELQRQILDCRARGMKWADIARRVGLSGPGAAHNIAYSPIGETRIPEPVAPPVPVPALDPALEKRLWWTTVRPGYSARRAS